MAALKLRDFRNYSRLDAPFVPGFHVLLGANGQGKTNLLEAIYLLATLRSFRGVGGAQMIRHGARGYFAGATVIGQGSHQVQAYWSPRERRLTLDGAPVRRLPDYLGTLRAVVFCTEDLQLVKGAARVRRRFLDLLLAQTRPGYLALLLRYTRALRSRNALLKAMPPDEDAIDGFTREMVALGTELMEARRELVPRLEAVAASAHQRIAHGGEGLRVEYAPSCRGDLAVEIARTRARERAYRTTLVGPHRDDLVLSIDDRSAAAFASEGQKRTVALALKVSQAELLASVHGTLPILLIDDVMGELDARRRAGLMPLLQQCHRTGGQVFMTCTEESWPRELGAQLHRWTVADGVLRPGADSGSSAG